MKYIFFIFIALTILFSCKQQEKKTIIKSKVKTEKISLEETQKLIETYKEFELKHNEIFQQDLKINSKKYYDNLIKRFIEKETGFLRLFGELWDRPFKSENEIKTLWKLKIERYFRTTAYLTFVRNEVNIYTVGVNHQRNNGISKILGTKIYSNLKLPILDANSFTSKNVTVENIINNINKEIIDQLADTVLGFTLEIILGILSTYLAVKVFKHWSLSIFLFILLGVIFFWRSHNRQNEIREIFKNECKKALESTNIDYLDKLNKNTNDYYYQLQKSNYETNN